MTDELHELSGAAGEEDGESENSADTSGRMHILDLIERGQVSPEEGLRLLQALQDEVPEVAELDGETPAETAGVFPLAPAEPLPPAAIVDVYPSGPSGAYETPGQAGSPPEQPNVRYSAPGQAEGYSPPPLPPEAAKWRSWWMIPLWVGIFITAVTGAWMYLALQRSSIFGFLCASLPFALGVLVVALAWATRKGPWLHLRVDQKEGEWPRQIAFSFPLPLGLASWFLRTFGHRIPNLDQTTVDEVIRAVGRTATPDKPIYIQVDEGEDGEKVEIYIG